MREAKSKGTQGRQPRYSAQRPSYQFADTGAAAHVWLDTPPPSMAHYNKENT